MERKKKKEVIRQKERALALLLVVLLIWGALPRVALAQDGASGNLGKQQAIQALLADGQYVEGEVLAVVPKSVAETTHWFADGAETSDLLGSTSGEAYVTATQETLSDVKASGEEGLSIICIKSALSTEDMLMALWEDPRIISVEPNTLVSTAEEAKAADAQPTMDVEAGQGGQATDNPQNTTNTLKDLTDYQWGLENEEKAIKDGSAARGFAIHSPSWDQSGKTNASGVVAICDTGLDVGHPDLKNVVMTDMDAYNPEGGQHGINISGDGDVTDVQDRDGHGTHVAGIIASEWNDFGTSGVASGVKLASVKLTQPNGEVSMAQAVKAYTYLGKAMDNGLNLVAVNNSWGDRQMSKVLSTVVTELGEKGAISIFSSGNNNADSDMNPTSPLVLKNNPYAIVVNSSAKNGQRSGSSNYGLSATDLFAPGDQILSTASRTGMDMGAATYLSEADGQPLAYDGFKDSTQGADTTTLYQRWNADTKTLENPIPRTISDTYYYDNVGGSQKMTLDQLADFGIEEVFPGTAFSTRGFYLKIPVQGQSFKHLDFKLLVEGMGFGGVTVSSIATLEADGQITWTKGQRHQESMESQMFKNGSFGNRLMDCEATLGEGQSIYLDDQGNCVVKVSLGLAEDAVWADQIKAVYMDCLAAGDTDTPYLYASGTSMAAPMVTGGAAVAAAAQGMTDIQPAPADRSRLAKERAAWIKSHVTPYDSLKNLCATGGQLDLSRTDENALPVITGASLAPETNPAQVTIIGSHFGEEQGDSSVSIGGMTAKVTAWHENTITVIPDYRLRAGVLPVCVTTTAGSCTEGFLLEIPSQDNVPLFEKEIRLPQDISDNTMDNTLVGLGGDLYVMAQSQYTGQYQQGETIHTDTYGYGSYRELWRYRPNADTWTQCSDLPEQLDFLSATTWEGKLLVVGTTFNPADQRARTTLYSYNPEEDTWKAHGISGLPVAPAIINTENGLLLVGGGNASGMTALTENNIATLNMGTGTVTPVGTLHTPILNPKVALTSDRIFVAQGFTLYGGAPLMTKGMEAININGDYLCEDLSRTLPKLEPSPESESVNRKNYGLTATAEGAIISGVLAFSEDSGDLDADTFVLKDGHFTDFGKRAYRAPLFYPSSMAYDGWLYTMGSTAYDDSILVLRATAVQTKAQPGDRVTSTTINADNVRTGMTSMPGIWRIAFSGFALLLAVVFIGRSKDRQKN